MVLFRDDQQVVLEAIKQDCVFFELFRIDFKMDDNSLQNQVKNGFLLPDLREETIKADEINSLPKFSIQGDLFRNIQTEEWETSWAQEPWLKQSF